MTINPQTIFDSMFMFIFMIIVSIELILINQICVNNSINGFFISSHFLMELTIQMNLNLNKAKINTLRHYFLSLK